MTVMERPGAGEAALIPAGSDEVFAADVLAGLSKPQKELPCRWFYDTRGSELFEQITDLPEYYPTRTETGHSEGLRRRIACGSSGPGVGLIEYGAGAAVKTRILLDALDAPGFYAPIDISAEFLQIRRRYPGKGLSGHRDASRSSATFCRIIEMPGLALPGDALPSAGRRLGFFPGSTIGNLSDNGEIDAFLARAKRQLGTEGYAADRRRPAQEPRYSDPGLR